MRQRTISNDRVIALAAALAGSLAAAAPAAAEFDEPVTIFRCDRDDLQPRVAMDSAGRALIAWRCDDDRAVSRVQSRLRTAAGKLRQCRERRPGAAEMVDEGAEGARPDIGAANEAKPVDPLLIGQLDAVGRLFHSGLALA